MNAEPNWVRLANSPPMFSLASLRPKSEVGSTETKHQVPCHGGTARGAHSGRDADKIRESSVLADLVHLGPQMGRASGRQEETAADCEYAAERIALPPLHASVVSADGASSPTSSIANSTMSAATTGSAHSARHCDSTGVCSRGWSGPCSSTHSSGLRRSVFGRSRRRPDQGRLRHIRKILCGRDGLPVRERQPKPRPPL
jgi:hypothetical protein